MSTITIAIISAFVLGYFFIAIESITKINKAAIALLMFVVCWTIYMIAPSSYLPGVAPDQIAITVSDIVESCVIANGMHVCCSCEQSRFWSEQVALSLRVNARKADELFNIPAEIFRFVFFTRESVINQ